MNDSIISDIELKEIEDRCSKATSLPWRSFVEGRDHTGGSSFIMTGTQSARGPDIELFGASVDDQDFIAASRQDVPRLLAEVKRLRGLLKD